MQTSQVRVRAPRTFRQPRLDVWSINAVDHIEVTGQARTDAEREARISALGMLMKSPSATGLWQRVCCCEMTREIRARSADQRLSMELALLESTRRPT
ncbi:hypothetical protein B0G75_104257 [Paraburkholderia sp. BL18I3N2]|uniref:hypothetical protein n=1 Tax=Paraburkholderia sp. BL18I3N2 TaxID=1938799 RepID=UPI000D07B0CA|nr:hypothetical protein [Paraburkholderia sp. BL18I3N2]PRX32236.1 hypothetical protein B0G75_104257 [Paraburkholderia sp. BL18I3N2]